MKKSVILFFFLLAAASCAPSVNNASRTVEDVILSRRSIRQYNDQTISREVLDKILDHGINAPNGQNRQAYEIRVVDDPELLDDISEAVTGSRNSIFFGAPCVVFLANYTGYDMSQVDCGLLGENIILSAWSMGIGSCCMAAPVRQMKESEACRPYIERLGFSEGYDLLFSIVLGYPAESPAARPRKTDMIRFVE